MTRVLMLLTHPLFGQGVESLLRREMGLEIVGRETDADKVVERIKELRPDVVVVDGSDSASGPAPDVMRILTEMLGTRIVVLNSQGNTMGVYRGEQRAVTRVQDLVEAIEQPAFG